MRGCYGVEPRARPQTTTRSAAPSRSLHSADAFIVFTNGKEWVSKHRFSTGLVSNSENLPLNIFSVPSLLRANAACGTTDVAWNVDYPEPQRSLPATTPNLRATWKCESILMRLGRMLAAPNAACPLTSSWSWAAESALERWTVWMANSS